MKKSDILRAAKARLENRKDTYVCFAIKAVCNGWNENPADKQHMIELNRWVMELIHPYETYQEWLMSSIYSDIEDKENPPAHLVHNARIFWMDWMIAHWEVIEAEEDSLNSLATNTYPRYTSVTVGAVIN